MIIALVLLAAIGGIIAGIGINFSKISLIITGSLITLIGIIGLILYPMLYL